MGPSIPHFFGLGRWKAVGMELTATALSTRGIEIAKWKQYHMHFSFSFVTAKIRARHTSVPWTKITLRFVLHFAVSANTTNGTEFPSSISPRIENLQRWFYEGKNNKGNLVERLSQQITSNSRAVFKWLLKLMGRIAVSNHVVQIDKLESK